MKNGSVEVAWRDSARQVKFFFLPGQSVFPLFALLFYRAWWFVALVVLASLFFGVITRFGYTPKVSMRMFKCFIAGRMVESKPWWER